jgi:acyl-CoA thioesterase-1
MHKLLLPLIVYLFTVSYTCVQANEMSSSTANILVFGDSLSAGFMLEQGQEWPALLQAKLKQENFDYHVINASISGETTLGGLNRIKPLLDKYQPKWLILELGANDGLQGLSLKKMQANLQAMIELAQTTGAKVILTGMHIPPNYGKRYSKSFYGVFQKLQLQYTLPFVPFILQDIAGKPALNLPDGIHPTAAAQPLVLNNIWPVLLPELVVF